MRAGELVFVDTGAWIALALTRDPLHARAADAWSRLAGAGAKLYTSASVLIETFTFLDRHHAERRAHLEGLARGRSQVTRLALHGPGPGTRLEVF